MSDNQKQIVNTSSAEFEEGVEAGLNSRENTNNWHADNQATGPASASPGKQPIIPLFMRYTAGGNKGDAQDEKDETAE